jgi:hypothetical protein
MLAAGSGFSYWQDTRFPAHSISLKRTPVELRVQDGVKPRELRAVSDGVRLVDRFMKKKLRRTVRRPVEARIARKNGCHPFESSSEGSIGEADDGFFCVATNNLHWQWLIDKDLPAAIAISAHEYVHVLQADLGCLATRDNQSFRWLIEGMADEIAWRALISADRVTDAHVLRAIRYDAFSVHGVSDRGLDPLSAYERADGADREYALWHVAVRRLLGVAVNAGAAPAARPEIALRRFCERVGRGLDWRRAFAHSFGKPVDEFYDEFEAFRRRSGDDA